MAHGDTQETKTALRNVHRATRRWINEAMQLWIDTARELGDPVPEPKGERLMFALIADRDSTEDADTAPGRARP